METHWRSIRQTVKDSVSQVKELADVKKDVLKTIGILYMKSVDENYVEYKFFKYCRHHWEHDISTFLRSKTTEKVGDLVNEIISVHELKNICHPFCNSPFFVLIMNESRLLTDNDQYIILQKFKLKVAQYVVDAFKMAFESRDKCMEFIDCLSNFVYEWKSQYWTYNKPNFNWTGLNTNSITFETFLKSIVEFHNDDNEPNWKEYCQQIPDQGSKMIGSSAQKFEILKQSSSDLLVRALLHDSLKENVILLHKAFSQPMTISVVKKNLTKNVLQIKQTKMILSSCYDDIIKKLDNSIDEIHILAFNTVFINQDLTDEAFKGKNVVVLSKNVVVANPVTWNVSGKNGTNACTTPNNTGNEADGVDGADGDCGESGGNVSLISENFQHLELLKIISNGGNGGNGQPGGNGKNGNDGVKGHEISLSTLKSNFPSPAVFSGKSTHQNLRKTVSSLNSDIPTFLRTWNKNVNITTGYLTQALENGIYLKGTTREGCTIEFSYYEKAGLTGIYRQSYLLYEGAKGSVGTLGGMGGLGGLGGDGGFAGNVAAYLLDGRLSAIQPKKEILAGNKGTAGKNGNRGSRGKTAANGLDVGYTDRYLWNDPVYFGPGTFETIRFDSDTENTAWCSYYDKYTKFQSIKKPQPEAVSLDTDSTKQRTKAEVTATRKDAINANQVVQNYSLESQANQFKMSSPDLQQWIVNNVESSQNILEQQSQVNARNRKTKICKPVPTKMIQRRNRYKKHTSETTQNNTPANMKIRLTIAKYKLLEMARMQLQLEWDNWSKTKPVYVKRTTCNDTNSAFHAIFGELNQMGYYEAESKKRKEFCDKLKKVLPFTDDKSKRFLQDSLKAFFEDKFKIEETYRNKVPSTSRLDKYRSDYENDKKNFGWNVLLKDKSALSEYPDFLCHPGVPMLISDVNMLGVVYDLPIQIYFYHNDAKSGLISLELENGSTDCRIAVDERNNFSKVVPVMTRDMNEVHQRMNNIINEVESLSGEIQFKQYLGKLDLAGLKDNYRDVDNEVESDVKLKADIMVNQISNYISDDNEKILIEATLLGFPVPYLEIICERLHIGQIFWNFNAFEMLCADMLEASFQNENTLIYKWIIATYPIDEWIKQFLLLNLERKFDCVNSMDVVSWKKSISTLPNQLIVFLLDNLNKNASMNKSELSKYLETLAKFGIKESWDIRQLDGIILSQWPSHFKKLILSENLKDLSIDWNSDGKQFGQSLYYLHALQNEKPKQVKRLLEIMNIQLNESKQKVGCGYIVGLLSNIYGGKYHLDEEVLARLEKESSITNWTECFQSEEANAKHRSLEAIESLIFQDENSTLSNAKLKEIFSVVREVKTVKVPTLTKENFTECMRMWKSEFDETNGDGGIIPKAMNLLLSFTNNNSGKAKVIRNLITQALAMIDQVIDFECGFRLRDTQKTAVVAAVMMAFGDNTAETQNILAQVATGEGKSLIVLSVAIITGLLGQTTDIVTSSSVLAQRDAIENKNIYEAFGITVGDNTSENETIRASVYGKTVVYGEVSSFQRDFLLDRFYNQNIRGSRQFHNVIVDEVDSMFLDKGNSVLYLSHQPPGLDTLEALFIYIWSNVVQCLSLQNFSPMAIHESVLENMYATLTPKDIQLMVDVAEFNDLWDWLASKEVIANNGRIAVDKNVDDVLKQLPEKFTKIKRQLTFLLKKRVARPTPFKVMNYLKPFVERHLLTWIANAYQATQLVDGREYIVDVDHTKTKLDRNPRIMILDLNTGTDLRDSQWSEGLHQFLQIKHGCKMTMMSLKAVFISNVSFFKKYKRIFGLTGTIGTDVDRDFLRTTYSVELISIPLALPKQFIEEEPKIAKTKKQWKEAIYNDTIKRTEGHRSVLIICETVNDAEELYQHFSEMKNPKLTDCIELYRRDYERFQAAADGKYLEGGKVLIATNLAGRGTDIKVSDKLNVSGGLHVCLSYLPDNLRVEQQAFGRCARKGNAGSGRLIFVDENTNHENSAVEAIDLKIERDEAEFLRVSNIKEFYEKVVQKEELMFAKFQDSFRTVSESLAKAYEAVKDHNDQKKVAGEENENQIALVDGDVNEIKELVMYSMLDDWAFWVDEYEMNIVATDNRRKKIEQNENSFREMVRKYEAVSDEYNDAGCIKQMFVKAQKKIGHIAIEATALKLIREPALLVKVGKCFINRKKYRLAKMYFDSVIESEPDFCTAALYYKTLTMLNAQHYTTPEFTELVERTMENVEKEVQRQSSYAALAIETNKIVGDQTVICTDAYSKQKENYIAILNLFKTSLEALCGKRGISPEVLLPICNEDVAGKLYEILLKQNAIEEVKVTDSTIAVHKIRKVAEDFSMKDSVLAEILSQFRGKHMTKSNKKELKKKFELPSREEFWKQIKNGFLDEKCFAVIKSETVVKGAENAINDFKLWKRDPKKPLLSKYGTDMTNDSIIYSVVEGNKREMKKERKFINWRKIGRLCYENVATPNLQALKTLKLTKYHRIEKKSFTIIDGIDDVDSAKIFNILIECKIINSEGILATTDWQPLKSKLTIEFMVYYDEISSILYHRCCYQYELLSLIHTLQEDEVASVPSDSTNDASVLPVHQITIRLPIRPHNDLILSLMDINVVENSKINWKYFEESLVKSIWSGAVHQPLVWAKWFGKKTGIISQQSAFLTSVDIEHLFPEAAQVVINELIDELNERKWLDKSGKIIWTENAGALRSIYEHYERDLRALVQLKIKLTEENFLKEALEILKNLGGKLKTMDSPHCFMVSLEDQFHGREDRYDYLDELVVFNISGFEHIIDTVEKRYTWMMILSTVVVIGIGICQIVIGIIIQYKTLNAGTFLASALMQEGMSDIFYGMQCFYHGHFSWKDYANHKWTSMAITAATMGIGALLAKGVKYSKYGIKLFGPDWMKKGVNEVARAAKNTGKGGIHISIFKTLAKSAGYKILQGFAFGAANMAISYAYEKGIKRIAESVSTEILSNVTESVNRVGLSQQLETLVVKCGVSKAQEILDRSSREAYSILSYKEDMTRYMQTILGVLISGVGAACAKFNQASEFSNTETAIVFTLLEAYNYALKTIQILDALQKIRIEADAYLNRLSAVLASEIDNATISPQLQKPSQNDIVAFQSKFKEETKKMMREKTGSIMQTAIIEPLLRAGCQKLLTSAGKLIRGKYRKRNEKRYLRQAEEIGKKFGDSNLDKEERQEMHHKLLQLASKSRNPDVVAEIVRKGGALGIDAVQALANKLNVTITIESDNGDLPKVINPRNGKGGPIGTLNLKHTVDSDGNFGHWESKSSSSSSPTEGFSPDCLLDAVNNELKEQGIDAEPVSRSNLAEHMKWDPSFRDFIKNGWHNTYNSIGGFGGTAVGRCFDKIEITDKVDEKAQIKLLADYEKHMDKTGQLKTNRNGSKYVSKLINGKECTEYQSGTITKADIARGGESTKKNPNMAKATSAMGLKGDEAGHILASSLGGLMETSNLYSQNSHINRGIIRELEKMIREEICSNHANVDYKMRFSYPGSKIGDFPETRPFGGVLELNFRYGSRVVTKVYMIPNPPNSRKRS